MISKRLSLNGKCIGGDFVVLLMHFINFDKVSNCLVAKGNAFHSCMAVGTNEFL
jgi:hypothetical protein